MYDFIIPNLSVKGADIISMFIAREMPTVDFVAEGDEYKIENARINQVERLEEILEVVK